MSRLRPITLSILACVSVFATGCSSETEPTTAQSSTASDSALIPPADDGGQRIIGFSQCNAAEPYRTAQNNTMLEQIWDHPDVKLVIHDAQQDNANQIAQIENMIQNQVDVLIVAPNEAAPITPVVKRAKQAGIKVVCLERNLLEPVYDVFVGVDNLQIGRMAGEFIVDYINENEIENPVIVEMKGLLGTKPQEDRHNGAHEAFATVDGLKIVEDVANWNLGDARTRMETILEANPKIDVVYGHNDPMAVGCYLAAEAAGRADEMIFVGIDGLGGADGGIQHVIDGRLACTFHYPLCAKEGFEAAVKLAKGQEVEPEIMLAPAIITSENAQEWFQKTYVPDPF